MSSLAREAARAVDTAALRLAKVATDDRLTEDRADVDQHLQGPAVEALRLLGRLYGVVVLDDEPTLLDAYVDPDQVRE